MGTHTPIIVNHCFFFQQSAFWVVYIGQIVHATDYFDSNLAFIENIWDQLPIVNQKDVQDCSKYYAVLSNMGIFRAKSISLKKHVFLLCKKVESAEYGRNGPKCVWYVTTETFDFSIKINSLFMDLTNIAD